jgi:2-polyprenyl-3-methyl-5-hydroxy-6-metoxy-1,4-benzoquinol methylase
VRDTVDENSSSRRATGRQRRDGGPKGKRGPRGWQHVAGWYDALVGERGSEYQQKVVIPRTLVMLEAKAGERVLDVACGQGVLCRALAEQRVRVTGVDVAPALIEAARRRNASDRLAIEYRVGDARRLAEVVEPGSFDAALCVLAIQNLTPLSPVWEGCWQALQPGGRLVVVLMHPCFRIPRSSHWGWDERAGRQYRRVERYLTSTRTEIKIHPGADPSRTAPSFHRPLQAYVNTLGSAGLTIDRLEEWPSHKTSPAGPKKAALDESRREIPMFLALRARKSP